MKSLAVIFLISSVALVFSNCSPSSLDAISYIHWVENEENELQVSKEIDGFSFTLQYKPAPYIVLMENNGIFPGTTEYQQRLSELGDMQYYTLRIRSDKDHDLLKAGTRSENEYYSRLEYFTSVMQDDLQLIDGDDTMACVLYHYERNYNLSPQTSFVLGFSNNSERDPDDERILILNDQALGIGTIKLSISEDNIQNIPALTETL